MTKAILEQIIEKIPQVRIGLIGDCCVDVYWDADMRLSELSREVPQFPLPVVNERYSLGAGGNVLANLAALGAKDIKLVTCIGTDWRSFMFKKLIKDIGVSEAFLLETDERVTPAYCKPMRHGISDVVYEDARIDFVNRQELSPELKEMMLERLRTVAAQVDVLLVCDQMKNGCITEGMIKEINELGKKLPVLVDSRDRIGQYQNVIMKPNDLEASRAVGMNLQEHGAIKIAQQLEKISQHPIIITLGENGALWCENGQCTHAGAFTAHPPIDIVGAGDSFLAGFSVAYAGGAAPYSALRFGSLVSNVTIHKIGTTGTATPDELRQALGKGV